MKLIFFFFCNYTLKKIGFFYKCTYCSLNITNNTCYSIEISFSKLKLIKSYLKYTISQERISELAILSIKKKMLRNLNTKV